MSATPSSDLPALPTIGVAGELNELIAKGEIRDDRAQKNAAEVLDNLRKKLLVTFGKRRLSQRLQQKILLFFPPELRNKMNCQREALHSEPRSLYLWGAPGSGKSMLMNLFFRSIKATPALNSLTRRRVHFLTFMEEMHAAIAKLNRSRVRDPIGLLAQQVVARSKLLCFDEFVVEDIVDAMLLGRLFEALVHRGIVLVATSNFAPANLYKDGFKRDNFLPFLKKLTEHVESLPVHATHDYRSVALKNSATKNLAREGVEDKRQKQEPSFTDLWFSQAQGNRRMREMFALCIRPTSLEENRVIFCERRDLLLQQHGAPNETLRQAGVRRGVALSSFAEVCQRPRGVRDYRALLACCDLLFLIEIPKLSETQRNSAKRFMRLIDLFYEERAIVLCNAIAKTPRMLYEGASHAQEFPRTASRLEEMVARARTLV